MPTKPLTYGGEGYSGRTSPPPKKYYPTRNRNPVTTRRRGPITYSPRATPPPPVRTPTATTTTARPVAAPLAPVAPVAPPPVAPPAGSTLRPDVVTYHPPVPYEGPTIYGEEPEVRDELGRLTDEQIAAYLEALAAAYEQTELDLQAQGEQVAGNLDTFLEALNMAQGRETDRVGNMAAERGIFHSGIHAQAISDMLAQFLGSQTEAEQQTLEQQTAIDEALAWLSSEQAREAADFEAEARAGELRLREGQRIEDLLAMLPQEVALPPGVALPTPPNLSFLFPSAPTYASLGTGVYNPNFGAAALNAYLMQLLGRPVAAGEEEEGEE